MAYWISQLSLRSPGVHECGVRWFFSLDGYHFGCEATERKWVTAMNMHDHADRLPVANEQTKAYRSRREALLTATTDLTGELDAISEQSDPDVKRLERALVATRATLAKHVEESEADDGLLAEIVDVETSLSVRVEQLRREHGDLTSMANELVGGIATERTVDELLAQARELSARLDAHRHRATELFLDAYMLDISASD